MNIATIQTKFKNMLAPHKAEYNNYTTAMKSRNSIYALAMAMSTYIGETANLIKQKDKMIEQLMRILENDRGIEETLKDRDSDSHISESERRHPGDGMHAGIVSITGYDRDGKPIV